MIKQTVFITNFSSLYEILDENKENLSFNIIEHQSIEKLIIDKNFDLKNSLIITKPNNKLNFNKVTPMVRFCLPISTLFTILQSWDGLGMN